MVIGLGVGAIGFAGATSGRGSPEGVNAVVGVGLLVAGPVLGMLFGSFVGAGVGHRTTIELE